ncbi:receptor activity-modifying protein 1-like [Acanthopagrus latus]|uniref:receptor activity-modifying protein 1-like n=1 Tax=Acanthopagrus latus TaxID=8177 RepID=UPI00187C92E0|nr:receptor activity-modifying protein 1-like [Acanthopagrus latus]
MAPQVSGRPQRLLLLPSAHPTMILYLLCTALILRVVDSHTVNVTEEELSTAKRNRTFTSENKSFNWTASSHRDKNSQTENWLLNNQTSAVITEDDENFQDQEIYFPSKHCLQHLLKNLSHEYCGAPFHTAMQSVSTAKWCVLKNVIRPYNAMTICLEEVSQVLGCYYPNPDIQDFFIYIHSLYFQDCSSQDPLETDAPRSMVIVLTLIPVTIIPVLVYVVVRKSEFQD